MKGKCNEQKCGVVALAPKYKGTLRKILKQIQTALVTPWGYDSLEMF